MWCWGLAASEGAAIGRPPCCRINQEIREGCPEGSKGDRGLRPFSLPLVARESETPLVWQGIANRRASATPSRCPPASITTTFALPDPCFPTSASALPAVAHPSSLTFQPGARTPMPSITRMRPQASRRHSRNRKNGASSLRQLHPLCTPKIARRAGGLGEASRPLLFSVMPPPALFASFLPRRKR